jgi:hypothetical protein
VFGDADDVVGSPGVVRNLADGSYELHASFGLGTQVTPRQAPSVLNAAYAPLQFWDGRAGGSFVDPLTNLVVLPNGASLETQALGPLVSDVEMGNVGRLQTDVTARVIASKPLALSPALSPDLVPFVAGQTYPDLFQVVFGTNEVTPVRIAEAIAAYERTQFTNQAPIDALAGNPAALTPLENQGRAVFNSPQTNCNICHAGPLTTNQSFQYIGVRPQNEDLGRFNVTNDPADRGRFKVPGTAQRRAARALLPRRFHAHARGSGRLLRPRRRLRRAQQEPAHPSAGAERHAEAGAGRLPAPAAHRSARAAQAGALRPSQPVRGLEPRADHLRHGQPGLGRVRAAHRVARAAAGGQPELHDRHREDARRRARCAGDRPDRHPGRQALPRRDELPRHGQLGRDRARRPHARVGDGAGWISRTLSIPVDSSLIGTTRFAQWFILDPSGPGGFSASEAVRFTYF